MSEHNQKTLADLSAAYNPAEIEGGRYQTWEEAGFLSRLLISQNRSLSPFRRRMSRARCTWGMVLITPSWMR